MKLLKSSILVLVFALGSSVIGWSDCGKCGKGKDSNPEEHQQKHLEKMTKTLNLTPDQQAQVKQIMADKHAKVQPLHEQIKAAQMEACDKIKASLTEEQKAKFEKECEKKGGKKGKGDGCCFMKKK